MKAKHTPVVLTIDQQAALYRAIRAYYIEHGEHHHGRYCTPQPGGGFLSCAAATEDQYDSAMADNFPAAIAAATGESHE
ncbi:hypothetical protein [Methylibium sp.]|uniref:hypothetical protein n=1 Tax=Methylibium sp. TaxID=2067992 RepID=UPI003BAD4406